jgi:hypothetical protein
MWQKRISIFFLQKMIIPGPKNREYVTFLCTWDVILFFTFMSNFSPRKKKRKKQIFHLELTLIIFITTSSPNQSFSPFSK